MRIRSTIAHCLVLVSAAASLFHASETVAKDNVSLSDLFRSGDIQNAALSPGGDYVAFQRESMIIAGNDVVGYWTIHDFDAEYVIDILWIGADSLVVETRGKELHENIFRASQLELADNGAVIHSWHEVEGYIDDPLIDEPEHVIFARERPNEDDDTTVSDLYRINIFNATKKEFRRSRAVKTGAENFHGYVQNGSGRYVLAHKHVGNRYELWQRAANNRWSNLWVAPENTTFSAVAITPDGRWLWALTNAFTDKVAAVKFDLRNGNLGQVLFEHERYDLTGLQVATDGSRLEAVFYKDQGLNRYEFLDDRTVDEFSALQAMLPDRRLSVIGRSTDRQTYLVFAGALTSRGAVHRCELGKPECESVAKVAPWLDGKTLAETSVLTAESDAGVLIESFLTLPPAADGSIPLVTMPHGGPISVSDNRDFSPGVQWLAANGYAVLQVNYRGSGGYGKQFVAAGLRQWGRGIEDDIEAAVKEALKRYPQVDANRVGIFGGSYGGYSALMSVIRNPELFKCAASFAGVTDLTLMFSASRYFDNERLRSELIRIVGSPTQDYETLTANSPVYRYDEISRPVFLAHGTDDGVVDVEHSWRLRLLMRLAGNDPTFIVMDDIGHGFDNEWEAALLYKPLVKFLDQHLK